MITIYTREPAGPTRRFIAASVNDAPGRCAVSVAVLVAARRLRLARLAGAVEMCRTMTTPPLAASIRDLGRHWSPTKTWVAIEGRRRMPAAGAARRAINDPRYVAGRLRGL